MHPPSEEPPRPPQDAAYAFHVACPETGTRWTLRRTYMDFVCVHSKLVRVHGISRRHPAIRALLAAIVDVELSTLTSTAEFHQQLQAFAGTLAAIRLDCTALASVPCLHDRLLFRTSQIYALLTAFLQVPTRQVREEVRCVVSTAYARQDVTNRLVQHLDVHSPTHLLFELNDIFQMRQLKLHSASAIGTCR